MTDTPRHFLSLLDVSAEELSIILRRADQLKAHRGTAEHPRPLAGRSIALLFEKASTRTRISFEVGVHELGGQPVPLQAQHLQIGRGEPLADTIRILSRYLHAVVYRTAGHDRLEAFAKAADIPVVNSLSDRTHPCQLLADLMTLREAFGELGGRTVAWIGDGNNMAHSWIYAAARGGFALRLACPEGYDPLPDILADAQKLGADVTLTRDPAEAVEGVDCVTTDVWASMGQEDENAARQAAFAGYTVDAALMARAKADAVFLHCLPAHRGEEVTAEVLDGPQSRIWDEAENRLHAQKALLEFLVG